MPLHHYVPQFLLKRFANSRKQLRATSRGLPRETHLVAVGDSAAKNGLYTIPADDMNPDFRSGHDPESLEKALTKLEYRAAQDIRLIVEGGSPYTAELHYQMAVFTAVQLTRSPRFRQHYIDTANVAVSPLISVAVRKKLEDDELVKQHLLAAGQSAGPKDVVRFRMRILEKEYRMVPGNSTALTRVTMEFGIKTLGPELCGWTPRVMRFSEPLLLTSDVGAAPWSPGDTTPWNTEVKAAHMIFLPLNRRTVLAWTHARTVSDRTANPVWADHSNFALANAAERWIYEHPEDNNLDRVDLPEPQNEQTLRF